MTYRTGRTNKLIDVLELTDSEGKTVKRLEISLDIDSAARDISSEYSKVVSLNKKLQALVKCKNMSGYSKLAELYTEEITQLFKMCFGLHNTVEIMEFYENNCLEMAQQLVPYIFKRLLPEIKMSLKKQKKALKAAFKR